MGWFKKLIKGVGRGVKGLIKGIAGVAGFSAGEQAPITLALPPGYTSLTQGMSSVLPNIPLPGLDQRSWLEKNWMVLLISVTGVGLLIFLIIMLTKKK